MAAEPCPCVQCRAGREMRRTTAVERAALAVAYAAGELTNVQSRAIIIPTGLLRDLQDALRGEA